MLGSKSAGELGPRVDDAKQAIDGRVVTGLDAPPDGKQGGVEALKFKFADTVGGESRRVAFRALATALWAPLALA